MFSSLSSRLILSFLPAWWRKNSEFFSGSVTYPWCIGRITEGTMHQTVWCTSRRVWKFCTENSFGFLSSFIQWSFKMLPSPLSLLTLLHKYPWKLGCSVKSPNSHQLRTDSDWISPLKFLFHFLCRFFTPVISIKAKICPFVNETQTPVCQKSVQM